MTKQWKIQDVERIVTEHSYNKVGGRMCDATTANCVWMVYKALSPKNKMKAETIPFPKFVNFAWKQVK